MASKSVPVTCYGCRRRPKASQSVANTSKAVPERPGSSLLERPGNVQACRGQLWEDPRRSTAGRCRVVGGVPGMSQTIVQHPGDVAEDPGAFRHVPERPEDVGGVPKRLTKVVASTETVAWTFAGAARSTKIMFWRVCGAGGSTKIVSWRFAGPSGLIKKCSGGSAEPLD